MAKRNKQNTRRRKDTGAILQTGGDAPKTRGKFVQGRDASEIEKAIIEAVKLQMIGDRLFVTPEGGGGMEAAPFIKQNPDFRPGNQPDLDQFQAAGFFPDFTLPGAEVAPTTTTVPPLTQQPPQLQTGGAVQTAQADNPFGGLRLPADFLVQQFAGGGAAVPIFNPLNNVGGGGSGGGTTGGLGGLDLSGTNFGGGALQRAQSSGGGGGGGAPGGTGGSGANQSTNIQSTAGGVGGQQNTSGFQPLGGAAGSKLQDTIQTGNLTDTGALAQSNADVNRIAFDKALGDQNEQLGALGLGSSSTRSGQNQQLLNDFQLQTAQQNNQLGFQAAESAANRSLGAFSPLLQGSGQTLQGNIAQQGADLSNRGITSGENIAQAGINSNQLQQLRGFDHSNFQQLNDQNFQTNLFNAGGFASGGPVNRQDFISNAAFGTTFDRPRVEFEKRDSGPRSRSGSSGGVSLGVSGRPSRLSRLQEQRAGFENDLLQQQLLAAKKQNQFVPQGGRVRKGPRLNPFTGASGSPISNPNSGEAQAIQFLQRQNFFDSANPNFQTGGTVGSPFGGGQVNQVAQGEQPPPQQTPNTQQRPQPPQAPQFAQGGDVLQSAPGEIPGPAVPPDQVPILASGGEGIVPPDIMGALDDPASQTPEGAMAIVQALRDIMDFAPGPRGPEDQGGRGAGQPASRNAEIPRGQTGMRVPTGPPEGSGQRPDFAGPGVQRRPGGGPISSYSTDSASPGPLNAQTGRRIPNSGFDPNQDFQSAGGLPPAGGDSLAGFGNTFGNSDLAGVGGSDPLEFAPRDFTTEILNAQASVDNLLALGIKDGNRNTRLRSELIPQAQQRLDQLKIEADQAAQIANQALNAQGQADSGAAQLLNAQEGTERTRIAADAQVQAAGARNNLFGGAGVSPIDIAAPEFTPTPSPEEDVQAARAGDPAAIARLLQLRVITAAEWQLIEQTQPELARQVRQIIGQTAGQQALGQ